LPNDKVDFAFADGTAPTGNLPLRLFGRCGIRLVLQLVECEWITAGFELPSDIVWRRGDPLRSLGSAHDVLDEAPAYGWFRGSEARFKTTGKQM